MVPNLLRNPSFDQTLTTLLDKCKSISQLKRIHALLIASGLSHSDPFASKLLCSTSAASNSCDYSYRIFLQIPEPSVFNWNSIIRAFSNGKDPNKSISLFVKMLHSGAIPDHLTYPFLVKASARLLSVQLGMSVHDHVVKSGYECDRFIRNSLIHMYASCGVILDARRVFDEMLDKTLVSWNSMLDGYAKCKDLKSAREVFESMPERDVVSWSSLIDGYVKAGEHGEALALFQRMLVAGPKANEVTMVSVLCACAHLGSLELGRSMQRYMTENRMPLNLVLITSLVDMYAKCGAIEEALTVFSRVRMDKADVLLWNAIIGGLASHGCVQGSLDLFKEMQEMGVSPDEITYLGLLSACAHGGLVKEAWFFFECLEKQGMTPKSEHYASMVDVLARAGQLTDAYEFLNQMPVEPTGSMLGAFLSGCINHRRLDLAEMVGRRLIELEPHHDGRYVGLSNVYAVDKRWDEARTMREVMENAGVKKSPGSSCVEISGILHRFLAHDKTHPRSFEIYEIMSLLIEQMKDLEHEDEENLMCYGVS